MTGAGLSSADLVGARLLDAELESAYLERTDLTDGNPGLFNALVLDW